MNSTHGNVAWPIAPLLRTKEGIRIRKEIRLDQLEGFDQLGIGLDLD